ncbi:MAG: (d)CMP kinase, partial [Bacteroidales bacterium]
MKKIIIAIDGFSSCGKSTMAKALAKRIGYIYVDTGAMYRAVTLYCVQNGWMEQLDNLTPELLSKINITFRLNSETGNADTYLNGVNVEKEIRSLDISNRVSIVSALPQVRHELVRIQQQLGVEKG